MPHYIVPELLPAACRQLQRPQGQHATGPAVFPAGPGNAHPLLDHRFAGRLRDTTADGQIVLEVIRVPHPALVMGIVDDGLTKRFIAFDEILPVEMGSSPLQFLEKPARRTLLVLQSVTPVIDPGGLALRVSPENGRARFADIFSRMVIIQDQTMRIGS